MSRACHAALLLLLPLGACVLGREPEPARYFRPAAVVGISAPNGAATPASTAQPLRLHRVTAATHLSERIVWRLSDVEFGFYDTRRWTELPAHYVQQLLSQELFERRGLRRATAGRVPTLSVELLSFEEVLAPDHEARVRLRVLLLDRHRLSRLERTFTASWPIAEDDPVAVTRAIGRALGELIQRVADQVLAALPPAQR